MRATKVFSKACDVGHAAYSVSARKRCHRKAETSKCAFFSLPPPSHSAVSRDLRELPSWIPTALPRAATAIPEIGSGGTLSGTFTGTVEANGYIELADVQSISATLTVGYLMRFAYGPPEFFSFLPGSDSTLDLETGTVLGGFLCVGAVAAFAFRPVWRVWWRQRDLQRWTTQELPALTLISSVVAPAPPVPMPQPGTTEGNSCAGTGDAGAFLQPLLPASHSQFASVASGEAETISGVGGDNRLNSGESVRPRL